MVGHRSEYELLTFILAPTAPTSLRIRWSVKRDGQVHKLFKKIYFSELRLVCDLTPAGVWPNLCWCVTFGTSDLCWMCPSSIVHLINRSFFYSSHLKSLFTCLIIPELTTFNATIPGLSFPRPCKVVISAMTLVIGRIMYILTYHISLTTLWRWCSMPLMMAFIKCAGVRCWISSSHPNYKRWWSVMRNMTGIHWRRWEAYPAP